MDQTSMYSNKRLLVGGLIILGIILILVCFGKGERYGDKDQRPQITVSGKGETVVVPDIATFSFSVIETAKTVKEAQDKATTKTNSVIAYLKTVKIADKDVQTQGYNINPQYDYVTVACIAGKPCPSGKQVLSGYQVSQTVQVKVRDTAQAGTVLAGIGSLGVQNVSGLTLTVDNEEAVVSQARAKAIDDAKAKAQELAKQLGVRLVRIISFSEQGNYPIYYSKAADTRVMNEAATAPAPEIPTGENKITSNVTLTYEIR